MQHASHPRVSVVVPNYMHAPYLEQRLESISNQTFSDFEVILLDDCSTDGSLAILDSWVKKDDRFRLYRNDTNSGSTFAQWNKGADLARGDYLWFAESDDWADTELLGTLVPILDKLPNLCIAFGQSIVVSESGKHLHSYLERYRLVFDSARWTRPFTNSGTEEIRHYLMLQNVIPNASGALLRRSTYMKIGGADPGWRLNGDWMFYIRMLEHGDIAFVPDALNYFRQHDNTQRERAHVSGHVYREALIIADYIRDNHRPLATVSKRAYTSIAKLWTRSLFRQKWGQSASDENAAVNWNLFKRFVRVHPAIILRIPYEGLIRFAARTLDLLGAKEPTRRLLQRCFPGRFMPRST